MLLFFVSNGIVLETLLHIHSTCHFFNSFCDTIYLFDCAFRNVALYLTGFYTLFAQSPLKFKYKVHFRMDRQTFTVTSIDLLFLIINCKPMNFASNLELKNVIRTKLKCHQ